jgi:hypothetical protein
MFCRQPAARTLPCDNGHARQSLLFLERGPRKRAQLIAQSAEKLLDDSA